MASNTPNYNLKKPAAADFYHVEDQNANMDKLDAALKGLADGKAPATHAAQHAAGGSDPVTPASIGAAASGANSDITSLDGLTTVLSVPQGGTGKTAWTANRLIYPSAKNTLAQLAFPSVVGSLLRQGDSGAPYWTSLADLIAEGGFVKTAAFSYTGTGTYGSANPTTMTFSFLPKAVVYIGQLNTNGKFDAYNGFAIPCSGFGTIPNNFWYEDIHYLTLTVSASDKTVSFVGSNAVEQHNVSGIIYYYIAIG